MKMFTISDQTAKLIELGFKPPMWRVARKFDDQPPRKIITSFGELMTASYEDVYAYSIGELIEMLPTKIKGVFLKIDKVGQISWAVSYEPTELCCGRAELIDALYDMVVKLKAEGVI